MSKISDKVLKFILEWGFSIILVSFSLFMIYLIAMISLAPMPTECNDQEFTELKMSNLSIISFPGFVNLQDLIVDSDGMKYIYSPYNNDGNYKKFIGHNVTFSYTCYDNHKMITGVLMDNSENYKIYACKDNGKICWRFGFNPSLKWEISNITIQDFNTTTYYPMDGGYNFPRVESNNIPVYNPILDMYNNLTYNSSSFNYTYTHFDNINITPYDPEHDILIPV